MRRGVCLLGKQVTYHSLQNPSAKQDAKSYKTVDPHEHATSFGLLYRLFSLSRPSWCLTDPVTIHFPLATKSGYNQSVGLDDQIILTVGDIVDRPSKPEHAGPPGYAIFLAIRWNPPKASSIIFFQSPECRLCFFIIVAKKIGL